MSLSSCCFAFLAAAQLPGGSAAGPGQGVESFAGAELRVVSFEAMPSLRRLRQLSFPLGAVVPLRNGRLQVDVSTAFVSTRLTRVDSTEHQVDHLIDTQLRGAYVFGRDAVVATLSLNLPTGPRRASARDYSVIGAVSPMLLGFPVASYANGFSATAGLAAAVPAGSRWSVGLAGSLRMSARFTPYVDSAGPISYKPGLEGRIRAGADGLIGEARLSAGVTYSTFGDDQFGGAGTLRGEYRPGPRWLAEASLLAPVGATLLNLSVWNFHRAAGDTTGVSARNRENLASVEASLAIPIGSAVSLEPAVSGRFSKPEVGRGRLFGAGASARVRLSDHFTLIPTGRYDTGWIENPQGARHDLSGWYTSVFLRFEL